jgi:hypothetical protein
MNRSERNRGERYRRESNKSVRTRRERPRLKEEMRKDQV